MTPVRATRGFSAAFEVLAGELPEVEEEPPFDELEPEPEPPAAGVAVACAPLPVKATAVTVV